METGSFARNRPIKLSLRRFGGWPRAFARIAAGSFAAERERWAFWLPVMLGCGIALYFGLPGEPDWWHGPAIVTAAVLAGLGLRRRTAPLLVAIALGVAAIGFSIAQFRAATVAAPVLEGRIEPVTVTGRIVHAEIRAKAMRYVLQNPKILRLAPEKTPVRVRITVNQRARNLPKNIVPGSLVAVRAIVAPPRRRFRGWPGARARRPRLGAFVMAASAGAGSGRSHRAYSRRPSRSGKRHRRGSSYRRARHYSQGYSFRHARCRAGPSPGDLGPSYRLGAGILFFGFRVILAPWRLASRSRNGRRRAHWPGPSAAYSGRAPRCGRKGLS